jgi:hypothetical protein
MTAEMDFKDALETKVREQLHAQRVGYLLGAGSSYLDGTSYPLALELWNRIKDCITDTERRSEIQAKLDEGANGIEHALDLLDDGGPVEGPHRHLVTAATAELFRPLAPALDHHVEFVRRLAQRQDPLLKVFNLNYDPLIERAAEQAHVRLSDGFVGHEHAFFAPAVFEERILRIRGTHKGRQFEETAKPIQLLKLHGSVGWYESETYEIRRCSFASTIPENTKRLMIPPSRRKAGDTMSPPYSALWSAFRGALGQDRVPINRLVCLGYGFADEHVNAVIENALARTDFTVLIFTKELSDAAWTRWSTKGNVIVVTEKRCSLKGNVGNGHCDLWNFERITKEV